MLTIRAALQRLQQQLQICSQTPYLDAELLLCKALSQSREYLYTYPEIELSAPAAAILNQLLQRRLAAEPMAYIVGHREFWGLELKVTAATLVPRPETELLVELALMHLPNEKLTIADLGTGSGAIAIALAKERPQWQIIAIDQSTAALAVASENVQRYQLSNVTLCQGDWLLGVPTNQHFDAIISNPPYIPINDPHLQQPELRHEPITALAAGSDGLADLRKIIVQARQYLVKEGLLLLEHGHDQEASVINLLQEGGFHDWRQYRDLAGTVRVSGAKR